MNYRPEIDGLRAIAVVPVILFHAGISVLSGGFVGVDVFFVISGYLITSIIARSIAGGNFSLADFYEKRARRILPALFLVVAACIPFAYMWMVPPQLEDFGQSLLAVVFFSSNLLFWREDGYFELEGEQKPLLHTWSLSVEEQFYIVFPLLLALFMRGGVKRTIYLLAAIGAASFVLCEWGSKNTPSATFYLAPFRAWELLIGSLCALLTLRKVPRPNDIISGLGLLLVLGSAVSFDSSTAFPSVYALAPTCGTALVILFASRSGRVAKFLSQPLLVWVGLVSYSAYLWHQPLFAFARIRSVEGPPKALMLLLIVLTFVLAHLTWKFVERPFRERTGPLLGRRTVLLGASAAFAVAFMSVGIGSIATDGFARRLDAIKVAGYEWDNMSLQNQSWSLLADRAAEASGEGLDGHYWYSGDTRRKLLLIGNSHAKDMYNAFYYSNSVSAEFDVALHSLQIREIERDHPVFSMRRYQTADLIVIATRYSEEDVNALPRVLDYIVSDKKTPVIVANTPEFSGSKALSLADSIVIPRLRFGSVESLSELSNEVNQAYWRDLQQSRIKDRVNGVNHALKQIADEYGVEMLSRHDYICDAEVMSCYAMADDLTKNFYDYGHTTLSGARLFGERIDRLDWFRPRIEVARDKDACDPQVPPVCEAL